MKRKSFSISDIALGNLRHRKRQYVLIAAGIILAIYFTALTLLLGYSLYTSVEKRTQNLNGEQDVVFLGIDSAQWNHIAADDTMKRLGKAEILAMAQIDESGQNDFPIAKYDSEGILITHRRLIEGAFPVEPGEVALSRAALARLRSDAGIGDTIKLTMRIPDGEDFLPAIAEKTYTLTGILYDQDIPIYDTNHTGYNYRDYASGMFSPDEQIEPGGRGRITAYGILFAQNQDSYRYWYEFCNDNGIDMHWSMSDSIVDESNYTMIYTGASIIIVGVVLVLACCLGIVNTFTANLDARRRQIGLLRAVGATKLQIKRIFRRETLILALAAAPIGIGLAVASVYATFALLDGDFYFVPNVWVLLSVAVVGVGSILIASGIPLRRLAKISPMQAVRDVDMIRVVKKRAIGSKTQFNIAHLIASRSNLIYKTRKISIGIMLTAGILLFSMSTIMANEIIRQVLYDSGDSSDYRIYSDSTSWDDVLVYGFHAPGLTEGDRRDILSLPLVENIYGTKEVRIKLLPDKITSYATGDGWQWEYGYLTTGPLTDPNTGEPMRWYEEQNKMYQEGKVKYGYAADYLNTRCVAVEEDLIQKLTPYVYAGRINIEKLRSGEEVLLIAPQRYEMYYTPDEDGGYGLSMKKNGKPGEQIVSTPQNDMFKAGDPITMSLLYTDEQNQYDDAGNPVWPDAVRVDKTAKIGALIDLPIGSNPLGYDAHVDFLNVVTILSGLSAMGYDVPYRSLSVTLSEKPDSQTESFLQNSLTQIESRIPGARLYSNLEAARESRQFAFQFIMAALALVILMMAITTSMMNNTLSAHIRAGRRGIGTLRAVGVSDQIIFSNYLYQLLHLFSWGGGIGYVLSILFAVLIKDQMILGIQNAPIPFWQPILFIALLFGICLLNILSRLRSVLQESVIDNIRVL